MLFCWQVFFFLITSLLVCYFGDFNFNSRDERSNQLKCSRLCSSVNDGCGGSGGAQRLPPLRHRARLQRGPSLYGPLVPALRRKAAIQVSLLIGLDHLITKQVELKIPECFSNFVIFYKLPESVPNYFKISVVLEVLRYIDPFVQKLRCHRQAKPRQTHKTPFLLRELKMIYSIHQILYFLSAYTIRCFTNNRQNIFKYHQHLSS